ncbi:MAG: hypothetical protein O3C67_07470 [Cyanobacteria bacterium]|nr:hypothetical protein [Cyanobacteriota bacterium]
MLNTDLSPSPLEVIQSIEVAGFPIEVGLLRDGTPFLSGRGLAKACGISNSTLVGWGELTPQPGEKYRAGKMANLLASYGYTGDRFFVRVASGVAMGSKPQVSAYPYQVCMAFLDYYAFEAHKEEARNSLRILSEKQLPQFIYEAIGYPSAPSPTVVPNAHREPPLRGPIPEGYFSVFHLTARGAVRTLPTPSGFPRPLFSYTQIERAWHRYWDIHTLWRDHGPRRTYLRRCLDVVPHRTVDGYVKTYLYPLAALEAFQRWLNWDYIPDRFPSYRQRKLEQRLWGRAAGYPALRSGLVA